MILNLENKNILIVGGSKGIGKQIAMDFLKSGSNVSIISRTEPDNKILKQLFSQEHGFPNLNSVNLGGNKKISDLTPLLEIESLKNIYLDEKVQGSTLDRLMREEGIEKLLENGVNVKLVR